MTGIFPPNGSIYNFPSSNNCFSIKSGLAPATSILFMATIIGTSFEYASLITSRVFEKK